MAYGVLSHVPSRRAYEVNGLFWPGKTEYPCCSPQDNILFAQVLKSLRSLFNETEPQHATRPQIATLRNEIG